MQNTMIDYDALMAEDIESTTYEVPVIFDKEGESTAFLVIVGKNSNEYLECSKQLRAEGMQRSAKRKTQIDASTFDGAAKLGELIDENMRKTALAVVVDWKGFSKNGEPAEFSKDAVQSLLKKFPTWCERINRELENDANFMKA